MYAKSEDPQTLGLGELGRAMGGIGYGSVSMVVKRVED